MIPKIIHYCWFGSGPIPELTLKCIESWKKYCPDYEIMLWNESNFDINNFRFCREAYLYKKYAFVSDYARIWALYNYGGIYLDADMEVLKDLSPLLETSAFIGLEAEDAVATSIIGCVKNHSWIGSLLDYYKDRSFIRSNGSLDMRPNPQILTSSLYAFGFVAENKHQEIADFLKIYPIDYFSPLSYLTREIELTNNSYCIHHYVGSWCKRDIKKKTKFIEDNHARLIKLMRLIYKPFLKHKRIKL